MSTIASLSPTIASASAANAERLAYAGINAMAPSWSAAVAAWNAGTAIAGSNNPGSIGAGYLAFLTLVNGKNLQGGWAPGKAIAANGPAAVAGLLHDNAPGLSTTILNTAVLAGIAAIGAGALYEGVTSASAVGTASSATPSDFVGPPTPPSPVSLPVVPNPTSIVTQVASVGASAGSVGGNILGNLPSLATVAQVVGIAAAAAPVVSSLTNGTSSAAVPASAASGGMSYTMVLFLATIAGLFLVLD